jgi:membrane carboxypeptidase/penicillin-binding protein
MKEALKDAPPRDFTVPAGITFSKIDATTGLLALPTCPKVILESFKAGTEPREFCPVDHSQGPAEGPDTEE